MEDQTVPGIEINCVLGLSVETIFLDANHRVLAGQRLDGNSVGADQKRIGMPRAAPRYLTTLEVDPGCYES